MEPERYAEKLISEAMERGEFEPGEGTGKPLAPMTMDPDWWVRALLERERLPERRAELDTHRRVELASAIEDPDLSAARQHLASLNDELRRWNAEVPTSEHFEIHDEIWLLGQRAGSRTD